MILLKEGMRGARILLSSGIILTAACNSNDTIENLVNCGTDSQSDSVTRFLKEGEQVNVAGQPLKATSEAGGFEIVKTKPDEGPVSVEVYPGGSTRIKPKENLFTRTHKIYTISGQPAENDDGISGTQLTIRVDCNMKQ